MTIKLILAKTNYDAIPAFTDIKTVEVNLPLGAQDGWNVIGADWEYDIIHSKRQQELIEANRLIDALEQEIDQLTGNSRLQRREVSERGDMMDIERELEILIDKHKGKQVGLGEIRLDWFAEDCLKEIRRLKSEIARQSVTSEGIPVSERLPELEWVSDGNALRFHAKRPAQED